MAKKLAIVITITSRLITCVSSWPITPSSSAVSSIRRMPLVAHTVAFFCERPIAKALGMGVSITHTLRLGQVRLHAQSLDDPVQLGLFLGGDLFGAERRERDLVRGEELQRQHEHCDHDDQAGGRAGSEKGADEHHVDESRAGTSSAASALADRRLCRTLSVALPSGLIVESAKWAEAADRRTERIA